MSTSVIANRIHARERICPEDLQVLAPDALLVRGVMVSTKTEGGLLTPDAGGVGEVVTESRLPVRASRVFEIAKLPSSMSAGNPMQLAVGDIVLCRNVLVDPLYGNECGLTDMYAGVVALVERAPTGFDPQPFCGTRHGEA